MFTFLWQPNRLCCGAALLMASLACVPLGQVLAQEREKAKKAAAAEPRRVIFKPNAKLAKESNWSRLVPFNIDNKPYEHLIAHVALDGKFPVMRPEDKGPLFEVKMVAGTDEAVIVELVAPNAGPFTRVLKRDRPLSWRLNGYPYRLVYSSTYVGKDQKAESALAMIIVSCRPKQLTDKEDTQPPGQSSEEDQDKVIDYLGAVADEAVPSQLT